MIVGFKEKTVINNALKLNLVDVYHSAKDNDININQERGRFQWRRRLKFRE